MPSGFGSISESGTTLLQDGIPARYSLAILAFFGFVFNYMLRINMSVAIVAMVNQTAIKSHQSNEHMYSVTECQLSSNFTADHEIWHNEEGEVDWDEKTQALISGSFFWGYILTQFPGGRLAELYGAKYIFGFSIFLAGVVNILIPFAAAQNPIYLIALRVLLGVFEGPTYPSMHALLAHWAPPSEKSRLSSIVYSGAEAGTIIAFPLAGFLISLWGWKSVFFVMGFSSFIWFGFWMIFAFDDPESHPKSPPRISEKEKQLLSHNNISHNRSKHEKIPWKSIMTSMPFWAIVVCASCFDWGFWTFIQELPTYMKNVLGFEIEKNSLLSALPYTVLLIFGLIYGYIADKMRQKSYLSTTQILKISGFISLFVSGLCILLITFVGCDTWATVTLFTIAIGIYGANYSAFVINHIDLSPNFSGTLKGLTNTITTIPGWLAPLVAGYMTRGQQSLENWHMVFYITTGFCTFGCVFYSLFASGEVQPWNKVGGGTQEKYISEMTMPMPMPKESIVNENGNINVNGRVSAV